MPLQFFIRVKNDLSKGTHCKITLPIIFEVSRFLSALSNIERLWPDVVYTIRPPFSYALYIYVPIFYFKLQFTFLCRMVVLGDFGGVVSRSIAGSCAHWWQLAMR